MSRATQPKTKSNTQQAILRQHSFENFKSWNSAFESHDWSGHFLYKLSNDLYNKSQGEQSLRIQQIRAYSRKSLHFKTPKTPFVIFRTSPAKQIHKSTFSSVSIPSSHLCLVLPSDFFPSNITATSFYIKITTKLLHINTTSPTCCQQVLWTGNWRTVIISYRWP